MVCCHIKRVEHVEYIQLYLKLTYELRLQMKMKQRNQFVSIALTLQTINTIHFPMKMAMFIDKYLIVITF